MSLKVKRDHSGPLPFILYGASMSLEPFTLETSNPFLLGFLWLEVFLFTPKMWAIINSLLLPPKILTQWEFRSSHRHIQRTVSSGGLWSPQLSVLSWSEDMKIAFSATGMRVARRSAGNRDLGWTSWWHPPPSFTLMLSESKYYAYINLKIGVLRKESSSLPKMQVSDTRITMSDRKWGAWGALAQNTGSAPLHNISPHPQPKVNLQKANRLPPASMSLGCLG